MKDQLVIKLLKQEYSLNRERDIPKFRTIEDMVNDTPYYDNIDINDLINNPQKEEFEIPSNVSITQNDITVIIDVTIGNLPPSSLNTIQLGILLFIVLRLGITVPDVIDYIVNKCSLIGGKLIILCRAFEEHIMETRSVYSMPLLMMRGTTITKNNAIVAQEYFDRIARNSKLKTVAYEYPYTKNFIKYIINPDSFINNRINDMIVIKLIELTYQSDYHRDFINFLITRHSLGILPFVDNTLVQYEILYMNKNAGTTTYMRYDIAFQLLQDIMSKYDDISICQAPNMGFGIILLTDPKLTVNNFNALYKELITNFDDSFMTEIIALMVARPDSVLSSRLKSIAVSQSIISPIAIYELKYRNNNHIDMPQVNNNALIFTELIQLYTSDYITDMIDNIDIDNIEDITGFIKRYNKPINKNNVTVNIIHLLDKYLNYYYFDQIVVYIMGIYSINNSNINGIYPIVFANEEKIKSSKRYNTYPKCRINLYNKNMNKSEAIPSVFKYVGIDDDDVICSDFNDYTLINGPVEIKDIDELLGIVYKNFSNLSDREYMLLNSEFWAIEYERNRESKYYNLTGQNRKRNIILETPLYMIEYMINSNKSKFPYKNEISMSKFLYLNKYTIKQVMKDNSWSRIKELLKDEIPTDETRQYFNW